MKIYKSLILSLAGTAGLILSSCYEDKGNYVYEEVEQVEITLPENISAISNSEYLTFSPKIVSSINGEISPSNDNYEYGCKINYGYYNDDLEYERWVDIDEEKTQEINHFASFTAGTYTLWYTVTNKTTGVTFNAKGTAKIISSTYEGWMVLSNNGTEKKVRLDIIFPDSKGEYRTVYNLLGSKAPTLYRGTQLYVNPSRYANGEFVALFSYSGAYRLDLSTLETSESDNEKGWDFLGTITDEPISMLYVSSGGSYGPLSRFCVTSDGNAYAIYSSLSGAGFEFPMNTDAVGNDPLYKISPKVGTSMMRPGNSSCVLVYDETNKRFMYWNYSASSPRNKLILSLDDPTDKLFSYQTGKTLIDMESTRFDNGVVYSVLEDDQHQRSIYGINFAGVRYSSSIPSQESYYEGITAEHFNDAIDYAFHSQYPFVFYCYGNKVYSYNMATKALQQVVSLPAGETVSRVKFNLYSCMSLSLLSNQSEDFMNQQYQLIVASSTGNTDGGIVRFYNVGNDGTLTKAGEYSGFGDEIVDVTYRERM